MLTTGYDKGNPFAAFLLLVAAATPSAAAFDYAPQGALVGDTEGNYGLTSGGTGPSYTIPTNGAGYPDYTGNSGPITCDFFFQFNARESESIVAATCSVNGMPIEDYPQAAVKNMNFSTGPFAVSAGETVAVSSYLTVNSGGTYGASDSNAWIAPSGATRQGVLNVSWTPQTFVWDGNSHCPTAAFSRADTQGNQATPTPAVSVLGVQGSPADVGTYLATVSISDPSFSIGTGQPASISFSITPAPAIAPTSDNGSQATVGQSWSPPFDSPGSGGQGTLWSVVTNENGAGTNWGQSSWTPSGAGTYQFFVGEMIDGNHAGSPEVTDAQGVALVYSGPYTVTVQPAPGGPPQDPPAPDAAAIVTIAQSGASVAPDQSVVFTVAASDAGGLNEIGLELCDPSGNPTANLGLVAASGDSASHAFTWQSASPGTYYFDGYAWNVDRSVDTRTSAIWVTVASAPPAPDPPQPGPPPSAQPSTPASAQTSIPNAAPPSPPTSTPAMTPASNPVAPPASTAPVAPATAQVSIPNSLPPSTPVPAQDPTPNPTPASSASQAQSANPSSADASAAPPPQVSNGSAPAPSPSGDASTPSAQAQTQASAVLSGSGAFGAAYRDALAGSPTSVTQAATLANTGGRPLTVNSISVTGPFQISGAPQIPCELAAGAVMSFTLTFAPGSTGAPMGASAGSLTVTTTADSPNLELTGTCLAPKIQITWH